VIERGVVVSDHPTFKHGWGQNASILAGTVRASDARPSVEVLMPETHYAANGARSVDDHFFLRYRELLDAEDNAFDELEHAYEDGDRAHFELDLAAWRSAYERRATFLQRSGLAIAPLAL